MTDAERLEFADDLAEANKMVEQNQLAKKSMMKQMQAEIDQSVAHQQKLNNIVASKVEYRETDVEVKFDYEKGTITQIRKDTGEVILDRKMTQKEKQTDLLDEPILDE